jgi:malate dehydrogenase (oxaloacetate-decarboxylating)(NADP+)
MAALNDRPIIMPLSNPTSKSECTFEAAVAATQGRVLFASGSPYPPLQRGGRTLHPAQANNAYIFPAVGHAAVLARCREIRQASGGWLAARLAV